MVGDEIIKRIKMNDTILLGEDLYYPGYSLNDKIIWYVKVNKVIANEFVTIDEFNIIKNRYELLNEIENEK